MSNEKNLFGNQNAKILTVSHKMVKFLTINCKIPFRPSYNMHNLLIWCISSILHFEQKQAIYPMINDMCNSISGHQRHTISKKKNMMSKKKRNKNDKIPRDRDWTLTTDRNMVRSDALPTELRGTCQHFRLNFRVMFEVSYALQRSSLET